MRFMNGFAACALIGLAACAAPGSDLPDLIEPATAERHPIEDRGYDALHYRLEIQIPGNRPAFTGLATIEMAATQTLREIVLDAADMFIRRVTLDGTEAAFEYGGGKLTVTPRREIAAGQEVTLRVAYDVDDPIAGLHFSLPGDSGVKNAMPQVFSQGEDVRAHYWFPCFDAPHERAAHDLIVTVPQTWEVIGAGRMTDRTINAAAGTATVTWSMPEAMPAYLFTLAAGPFARVEDRWQDVAITHYVEPGDVEAARASFARTADVLGFISEYTGFRYPFPKYAHVAVRDFPFGGMENVSATTLTRGTLQSASDNPEGSWGLVAHEAAHQWFGDVVTCASWPHIWLNEGFATYFTQLYQLHAFGEQAFLYGMGGTMDGYLAACSGRNLRALVKEEYRMPMDLFFDGTVYPGGASRLQLLRGVIGDEKFRAGINAYLKRNAYKSVTSAAFEAAMSEASGRDLSAWFQQWVMAPGYPKIEVSWRLGGDGDARVDLRQTQDAAGGVPQAFVFPLEIRWWEGGTVRVQRIEVDERNESFTLDLNQGFTGFLEFDPNVWVPATWTIVEEPAATMLRARQAGSARVRALACRDLAARGGESALDVLFEAAQKDVLPALRAEAARLAGGLVMEAEALQLHAAYQAERDQAVREAWWAQLSRFAALDFVAQEMSKKLADSRAPKGEREAALRGLAKALPAEEARQLLTQTLLNPQEAERLRVAAAGLLSEKLPDGQSRSTLLPLSWSGTETPLRAAALRALGPWLDLAEASDPAAMSVVDSYRKALGSPSAVMRRTAAEGAGRNPRWFQGEIDDLMRREPDTRIRRLLEGNR
jgi:aminopeptidase N